MTPSEELFTKIVAAFNLVFPKFNSAVYVGQPSKQTDIIPVDFARNCVCDGFHRINFAQSEKHGERSFHTVMVDNGATFFVYWTDKSYSVFCAKDVDVDKMIAAVRKKLGK